MKTTKVSATKRSAKPQQIEDAVTETPPTEDAPPTKQKQYGPTPTKTLKSRTFREFEDNDIRMALSNLYLEKVRTPEIQEYVEALEAETDDRGKDFIIAICKEETNNAWVSRRPLPEKLQNILAVILPKKDN